LPAQRVGLDGFDAAPDGGVGLERVDRGAFGAGEARGGLDGGRQSGEGRADGRAARGDDPERAVRGVDDGRVVGGLDEVRDGLAHAEHTVGQRGEEVEGAAGGGGGDRLGTVLGRLVQREGQVGLDARELVLPSPLTRCPGRSNVSCMMNRGRRPLLACPRGAVVGVAAGLLVGSAL
jgi:hypothetical protein